MQGPARRACCCYSRCQPSPPPGAPTTAADFAQYKQAQSAASDAAYRAGDYARSREIELEMLAASRKFGDRREEVSSIYGLGLLGTATGQLEDAEARFRESLPMWKAIGDEKGLALSLRGLGRVLEARGRLPEATEVQVAGLELLLKFGQPIDQSESYYSLARLFMNLEDYPAALRAVDRAIELMGPKPPDFPLGLNLAVRADVLRELGRLPRGARRGARPRSTLSCARRARSARRSGNLRWARRWRASARPSRAWPCCAPARSPRRK